MARPLYIFDLDGTLALMRKAGDHQDDVALKRGWLAEMEPPEFARLTAVFDDSRSDEWAAVKRKVRGWR